MNSFVTVLTVMSMFVAAAMSSDCSTACDADCANANADCKSVGIFESLCAINNNACGAGCAVVCGCEDSCTASCKTPFDECQGNANGNVEVTMICTAKRDVCLEDCEAGCAEKEVVGTVQSALGGGGK